MVLASSYALSMASNKLSYASDRVPFRFGIKDWFEIGVDWT